MSKLIQSVTIAALACGTNAGAGDWGTPDKVTSRLQVQVPKRLFEDGGYGHREALFGSPPYGGSIAQNVYYTDTDLCQPPDPTTGWPTRAKDPDTNRQKPWPTPFILMADRGTCSFVQKARNAQHAGAAGLIIADNQCLCHDFACAAADKKNNNGVVHDCQTNEPIMADDGSGGDITIPTFLMFKMNATSIIEEVKDNDSPVQIEMSWSLPHPDSKVSYELWTVPSESVSKDFQKQWKDVAVKMGHKLYFTPRQFIYDGVKSRCQQSDGSNICFNLCTNNGRYCSTDPDNDLDHGVTGAEVVKEALRRICIWKHYGEDGDQGGIGSTYWDYIYEFLNRCDSDDFFANEDCVKDAFKHSKIDYKRINQCMDDSGGLEGNTKNTLLEREIEAAERAGVVVLPTMFVNSAPLRGAMTINNVFTAVCAGFSDGKQPDICHKCSSCGDVNECLKKGSCKKGGNNSSSGAVSKKTFGLTLLLVCGIFGAAGYIHWRKTREEMRDQVRGILAEYMPLEGGENMDHNPMDFARSNGQAASLIHS